MLKIPALEKLVHELSRLPGVGPKSAQRLAYHILKSPEEHTLHLVDALKRVRNEVHLCPKCFNFTDQDICRYCSDPHRLNESICVVEEPSDIVRIEGSGAFRGRYHVLHGAISPLDGVGPDQLKIAELIFKIEDSKNSNAPIKEVILALDADLEGDTTVLFLSRKFQNLGIKLSRIAHGVPIGSDIDYIDDRTMSRALLNRVEV